MLIELDCRVVNTAQIREAEEVVDQAGSRLRITWNDGAASFFRDSLAELERRYGPITPAPVGYTLLEADGPDGSGDGTAFSTTAIIGFRLPYVSDWPRPITTRGEVASGPNHRWAVIRPDGTVDDPEAGEFSVAEWKEMATRKLGSRTKAELVDEISAKASRS